MSGYTKNIAVIKGLKDGFSADGSALSGLIKAEKYGTNLRIEVTFINFAPLTEGRYVTAVSDGKETVIIENELFEGYCGLDTGKGFGALICYVNGSVNPIASAVCGNYHDAVFGIKAEIERAENIKSSAKPAGEKAAAELSADTQYQDEAIAEDNYYEYAQADESGGALRTDTEEEKNGDEIRKDEKTAGAFAERQDRIEPLARGNAFYERMKDEIENIFSEYPAEENLIKLIAGSRWARIDYGDGKYYVFGILFDDGKPRYICYGVPARQTDAPPEGMEELASFVPLSETVTDKGYWVMYQDAATGASLKIGRM